MAVPWPTQPLTHKAKMIVKAHGRDCSINCIIDTRKEASKCCCWFDRPASAGKVCESRNYSNQKSTKLQKVAHRFWNGTAEEIKFAGLKNKELTKRARKNSARVFVTCDLRSGFVPGTELKYYSYYERWDYSCERCQVGRVIRRYRGSRRRPRGLSPYAHKSNRGAIGLPRGGRYGKCKFISGFTCPLFWRGRPFFHFFIRKKNYASKQRTQNKGGAFSFNLHFRSSY